MYVPGHYVTFLECENIQGLLTKMRQMVRSF